MTAEHNCFCELAPLYALNLLDEAEQAWVEQQIVDCPELADELAGYEAAVAAMPYSAPAPPLAGNLKQRLFDRLRLPEPQPAADPAPLAALLTVRSQNLKWQSHPTPGVKVAIFHRDLSRREISGLLRAEPGVTYPLHRHAATEELLMLEGDLVADGKVYGALDYIRSLPDSVHAPYTTEGCMFFFRTSMDDEYPELAAVEA
jgi:ChrR Cupin-like domain